MTKHLLCALALATSVAPAARAAGPVGPVTEITITANAIGPESEDCSTYVVTRRQVRAFFERAVLISASQEHDFFLHGPCSARGTVKTRYGSWAWELRNLGTATITADNGEAFLLGDPDRESPLSDDGSKP